jgi:hypothetical protein
MNYGSERIVVMMMVAKEISFPLKNVVRMEIGT